MVKLQHLFLVLMLLFAGLFFIACASEIPSASTPSEIVQRIAFGSCSNQYLDQPIWLAIIGSRPDLFLHLGDIIYGDVAPPGNKPIDADVDLIEKMRMDYALLADKPGFKELRQTIPFMATWDDHDFGRNDGGSDFKLKNESRELFFDFLDLPADSPQRQDRVVYNAAIYGLPGKRVQIIMLDTRSFRDPLVKGTISEEEAEKQNIIGRFLPHTDSTTTLLGAQQWQWLEKQLNKPAEVRLLGSSIQVVAGEKSVESWGNFPHERRRLYDLIKNTGAAGVIVLSGDAHFAEISKSKEGPYTIYDFTSSPLAQLPAGETGLESKINSFRISSSYSGNNFGLVEIKWDAQPSPLITLKVLDDKEVTVFKHKVYLHELNPADH